MFLVPLFIIVGAGVAIHSYLHRRPASATGDTSVAPVERPPFLSTTIWGRIGSVAAALVVVSAALVNVVQVRFLAWWLLLTALVGTGVARFVQHDRSRLVLTVLIVTAMGAAAAGLFLLGEVFIGHD